MAEDEIERLLREVSGTSSSPASQSSPKEKASSEVAQTGSATGRLAFAAISGAIMGAGGWFIGLMLPFLGAGSMGVGAALGAFITAMVTGAPRWFSR
jgi:hypothetical protein